MNSCVNKDLPKAVFYLKGHVDFCHLKLMNCFE